MTAVFPEWIWSGTELYAGWGLEFDAHGIIVGLLPPERQPADAIRMPGRLLLPGLVNAHSHAFQRAFRGHVQWRAAGEDDFWSWRDRMYAVAGSLTPEGVEAVSALACLEMAEAGVTEVGEFHYLHHQPDGTAYADPDELARRVIAAARAVGIRIALLRVAYQRAGFDQPLRLDQRRFGDADPAAAVEAAFRLAARPEAGVRIGLAPHSVRAVSPDGLRALAGWTGVVHAHVSEQPAENRACLAATGRSPLAVFADAGLVSERFSAVHLTHPMPGDLELLVAADAQIVVCPSTELDLGDGFLPLEARSARLCLGTDSHARIDLFDEARALELHARGLAGRRNVLAPPGSRHGLASRLLAAASLAGDRALGGAGVGLVPGAAADFAVVDLRRPAAEGVPPLEAAAFVATPEWVEETWVGGRRIVAGGRHPARDAVGRAAAPYLAAAGRSATHRA